MEGRALTAPPIVLPILAAIALTSRLSAPRLRTMAATHRKGVLTPRPLVPIPLLIGAIPRRADRIQRPRVIIQHRANRILRPSVATQHRAAVIPPLNVATLHRAVLIPRPNVAIPHPLPPAVPTLPRAAVPVAEAVVVAALAAAAVAAHRTVVEAAVGHRTAVVVAVGHIDKKLGTIYSLGPLLCKTRAFFFVHFTSANRKPCSTTPVTLACLINSCSPGQFFFRQK